MAMRITHKVPRRMGLALVAASMLIVGPTGGGLVLAVPADTPSTRGASPA
jgi:hypothetical protein